MILSCTVIIPLYIWYAILSMALVYLNPRKQQLEDAHRQRAALEAQREQHYAAITAIDQQIAQWDAYIAATAPLAEHVPPRFAPDQLSLADLCRMALDAFGGRWVTAQEVRDYLLKLGIRFEYNNVMAV